MNPNNQNSSAEHRRKRISWTVKPNDMTLIEWQRALRAQVSREEVMTCKETDPLVFPGQYEVMNANTRQTYKVVYRGENSNWNYCSCMDFKTSQLGTCKHIEKVKNWLHTTNRPVCTNLPAYTSVYLSYNAGREVKIRVGSNNAENFKLLANKYFDNNGVMLPSSFDSIEDIIIEGMAIDPSFRVYQDAVDFIIEKRDHKIRQDIIKKYTDSELDTLLTTKLYPYQKEGVRFAFERGRSVIADEMGLGKTVQAIATAEIFRREGLVENIIVVCPTSLKYQWQREIEKFVSNITTLVIEGNPVKRREQYLLNIPYKIVSYNCIANDIKLGNIIKTDLLIMDEVQRLKNWKTQISMAARKIVSDYAVILSGTPLENKLEELYTVMEFADNFCLSPFWQFKANCIISDGNGKVIGYQNLNKIGDKVRSRLIRRTKSQVALQMPKRQDSNLLVAMTKEQQECHDEFKSNAMQIVFKWKKTHFLSEKDRQRLLIMLSQMRMVCDSTYLLDQKSRYDTKIDETMNILQSVFESGNEKVVIFSQWERMTRLIANQIEKLGIQYEYLHGAIVSTKRKDLIKNFSDNPQCRVFLSTDAGSTGLNLQEASIVINLDLPWNPAVLEQRIARIYRLGQKHNIQVINLISKGTIEEQMLTKLKFKSAMFEGVLDNGEDTIYLGSQSKFTEMMNTLSESISEEEQPSATQPTLFDDLESNKPEPNRDEKNNPQSSQIQYENTNPQQLLQQGISFFSQLAQTLQSPQATAKLVDQLVETDPQSGQMSLKIPISSKESVSSVLNIIGKLFGGSNN